MWLPPGIHPGEHGLVTVFQGRFGGAMLDKIFSPFEQMEGFKPAEELWHLAFIAVAPLRAEKVSDQTC